MNIMVAIDKNRAIGQNGKLLVSIPDDQKFLRMETMGKVVVYGRKTLRTFPGESPLTGRTNIVLTRDKNFTKKGCIVCHSMEEALEELSKYNDEDIYILGGQSIYEQFLPYCNVAHITKINFEYEADTYFPDIFTNGEWKMTADSEEQTYFNLEYYFYKYERL